MTNADKQALLDELCRILAGKIGPDHGITLDDLAAHLGVGRRTVEALIQLNLRNLPCCLVADSHGYYRPRLARQLNGYVGSLRKRHQPLVDRESVTITKARAEGWPQDNESGLFVDRPGHQPELFT